MKHIKQFNQFVNEKIEYSSTKVNGQDVTSSWAGKADNEKDFIKMIENAPETLKSIQVQTGTSHFNPDREEFKGPITASTKKKIIKIIKDVTKEYKSKGDPITSYQLNSYYGVFGKDHESHPAYIQYSTKGSDRFANDMSSGKYGSLD